MKNTKMMQQILNTRLYVTKLIYEEITEIAAPFLYFSFLVSSVKCTLYEWCI